MKYVKNQIAARTNLEQIIHVQYAGLVSFVLLAINKAARQRLCQKWPSLEESGATDPRQGHQCSCQAKPFLLLPPFLRFTFSWHDSYVVWVGKQVKLVKIGLDWFSVSVPPPFRRCSFFFFWKRVELEIPAGGNYDSTRIANDWALVTKHVSAGPTSRETRLPLETLRVVVGETEIHLKTAAYFEAHWSVGLPEVLAQITDVWMSCPDCFDLFACIICPFTQICICKEDPRTYGAYSVCVCVGVCGCV